MASQNSAAAKAHRTPSASSCNSTKGVRWGAEARVKPVAAMPKALATHLATRAERKQGTMAE